MSCLGHYSSRIKGLQFTDISQENGVYMYVFGWCAALSLHIDGYLFDWCAAALVRLEALLEVGQRSQEHALLHQIQESIDCLRCKIAKRLLKDTMC